MICHKYKCIFIHQRKVAGSSIIRSFGFTPECSQWHPFNDGTLSRDWRLRDHVAKGYLVFTAVRNPWDRFISGWKYLPKYRDLSLDEVISNLPKEGHDYRHLTRRQLDTLLDEDGNFVPDFVLRYETLEDDYKELCRLLGKRSQLPKSNSTKHDGLSEYTHWKQIEFVREHFKEDVKFFSYEFKKSL